MDQYGELLTNWTARVAVAGYLGRYFFSAIGRRFLARRLWTAGCAVYLAHVVCAFGFVHRWSHRAAWLHTARQTHETIGWEWGGGLYFNYLFTLVWLADVGWMWWDRDRGGLYNSNLAYLRWGIDFFLAFMVLNATVVFGPPGWLWVAAGYGLLFVVIVCWRRIQLRRNETRKVAGETHGER